MAIISTVTNRSDGEVLTAAKYNTDHGVHETNATNLNTDKVETSVNEVQHDSSGFHTYAEAAPSLKISTVDSAHFDSLVASGDYSFFASADVAGLLIADRLFTTADVLMSGDVRIIGKLISTVDQSSFATADFSGFVTADVFIPTVTPASGSEAPTPAAIYRNSVVDAYVQFNMSNFSITKSFNIATVLDVGTGNGQASFTVSMDSNNYVSLASATTDCYQHFGANLAGKMNIFTRQNSDGGLVDREGVMAVVIGGRT